MLITPQDFVSKWKRVTAREKQTYQEHFLDICQLVAHHPPTITTRPARTLPLYSQPKNDSRVGRGRESRAGTR
jgi:hypothetical protein